LKRKNKKKEYIGVIFQESKALENIIEKVLDTVNLENDRIMINVEPYNSGLIVSNAIAKLSDKIKKKNIKIIEEFQEEFIIADPIKAEQVVTYVLDNAINVSKEGETILIESFSQDNRYTLYVKDNGPGIPANAKDVIFEKFKLIESLDKHSKGLGLSLHIAKYIMKKMNGKIYLQNPGEKGAVFALEFKKSS
jgi:K+-sensing histidine kinase KdpD